MSGKISSVIFSLLFIFLLIVASAAPACTQRVHENPANAYPSYSMTIEEILNYFIEDMQFNIEDIAIYLNKNDYRNASESFEYLNYSVSGYQEYLWRLNLSESMYESIANNINFTRDELGLFIQNSEQLNYSIANYNHSISTGNMSGANISLGKAQISYEELTAAYDRLRANQTAIEKILTDNNIDTEKFRSSMNYIDNYMVDLSARYNGPEGPGSATGSGPGNGSTAPNDFIMTIEPVEPSLGDSVLVTTMQKGANAASYDGSTVNIYFNSVIVGSYRTDAEGGGSMSYVIPLDTSDDVIYAHAEAIPRDRNKSRIFSNVEILYIPNKQTELNLTLNKSTISYGEPLLLTGSLMAIDGIPAPNKNISIMMNDEQIGYTYTDKNGSFNFTYNVTPDTRAGKNTFFASYNRKPGNVFLSASSEKYPVSIAQKETRLSINNATKYNIGDIGHVKGALITEDNVTVKDASIQVYVDGALMGSNATDNNGNYNVVIRIPGNATVGTHELFTAFQTNGNQSLLNSTTDKQYVEFGESVETLTVSGVPLIVFQYDTLNINATLRTASGLPVTGREFNITTYGINIGNKTTDDDGNFNASYWITGNETFGYYTLSIDELSDEGVPPINRYTGHFILIPYTRLPSIGASALILLAIIAVGVFVIRSRRTITVPEQMIVDSIAEPVAIPDMPAPPAPAMTVEPKEVKINVGSPAPFATSPVRMSQPGEKPLLKPAPEKKTLPVFNMDSEIMAIRTAIRTGNVEEAMTGIYLATRKIAIIHGLDVPDSMTHKEFYAGITGKYPALSTPLTYILYPYEIVAFAGRLASEEELNAAVNGLKEFYFKLENEEVGTS